jgi:hypothetical protein
VPWRPCEGDTNEDEDFFDTVTAGESPTVQFLILIIHITIQKEKRKKKKEKENSLRPT